MKNINSKKYLLGFTLWETIFTALCLLSIGWITINRLGSLGYSNRPYLIIASTAFVLIPICSGAHRFMYGRLVLIALVLCWLGDYFGPSNFLFGASFFLIGHFFLMAACLYQGLSKKRFWIALLFAAIVTALIAYVILPSVYAHERWFVLSYITVITVMCVLALSTKGQRIHWVLSSGAVLFYISDVLLALDRYVKAGIDYTLFGYPLYYGACVLFALSVSVYQREQIMNTGE